ncbi:MAG: hypothetical protein M1821_002863 [Bathelium mastoideum]|nr:MAG: hypothetical protein M1821_002863 [Bathelium mastoideum]KAI9694492.1 MAG: hypothetical protein M1822_000108 [Bathelium mastoideum]
MQLPPTPNSIKVNFRIFQAKEIIHIFWLLIRSDIDTFLTPTLLFGICSALGGSSLTTLANISFLDFLARIPNTLCFLLSNLVVLDLSNQRLPKSVKEDSINKPHRPIPSGRLTSTQMSQALSYSRPLVLFLNYLNGTALETGLGFVYNWIYDDLGGADELTRDILLAIVLGVWNIGSLRATIGPQAEITRQGYVWIALLSAVILTTAQAQDLKDQEGDKTRGRKNIPLVFGDAFSRWSIAIGVIVWSFICLAFWGFDFLAVLSTFSLAGTTAYRFLWLRNTKADKTSWKWWCLWMTNLYALPLIHQFQFAV